MNINSRDDQAFLKRLIAIVEVNLNNEQFWVNELAAKMGVSRSMVHRRLKSISNQSISQFIREIRLKKAKELLEQGELTVSEIAYKVGFGSPSYFIKSFHDYFGYAPREYMKYSNGLPENNNLNSKEDTKKIYRKRYSFIVISAFILVSITVGVYIVFFSDKKARLLPAEKSIAILPLDYVGVDQEVHILAGGVVEDILNRLSQVKALTVKCRVSGDIYRNSEKTISEIADELQVSYLGRGTILKVGEMVRIYIEIVDATNGNRIWSKKYEEDSSGILNFITDVSRQIAEEMVRVLSESEKEQVEKIYTMNTEAYLLYQKGRYFWHLRGRDNPNLNLSIKYFNQALELDSGYALAYAGLADVYAILPYHSSCSYEEAYNGTIEYANKALSIDSLLDEPHVSIAAAETFYKWNWNIAEKEFKKALKLNPNNADAYQFYAEYLHKLNKLDEARIYANKAINLDPNAYMKYYVSTWLYYDKGKFNESLKASEKLLELKENYQDVYDFRFRSFFRLKEYDRAFKEFLKYLELSFNDSKYLVQINDIYKREGMPGILQSEIDRMLDQPENIDYREIAIFYGLLNNKDSALVYLEKAFKQVNVHILDINVMLDFRFLHGEPRFDRLVEKLNLPVE